MEEQEHTALTLQNTAGAIYQGNSQLEGTHSFHFPLSLPPRATAQIIEICLNFYIKGTGLWRDEIKGGAEGKFWRVSDESGADTGSNLPLFQRTALKKQIQWMKNIF